MSIEILSPFQVQRLAWTLLHFLWQGTAIVIVYTGFRRLLARFLSARGRYRLACTALLAMVAAPLLTFLLIPSGSIGSLTSWNLSASEGQRVLPGVVVAWLLGVLLFSLRLLGAWRFTNRLRSTSHPASAEWQRTLERIAAQMGNSATRPVRLLVSSLVHVPTVIGWLRPVILAPMEFLTGLPLEHIEALLAHELAHIRRRDYIVSILQCVAEAVLFYHPAVWWISEQMRAERELCCDDLAVAVCGDVLTYARALAELECLQPPRLKPLLAANGGSLVNRIRRLIEPAQDSANNLPGPAAAWAMVLFWIAGLGVSAVHAAQTATPAPPLMNLSAIPVFVPSPAPVSPFTVVARHARNTLLYDPFLSAQLAQPAGQSADNARQRADNESTQWKRWINEDVRYIITDEERKAFIQLNTDDEREQFVEQFWLRRDPTPNTSENEYKEELYRRIAYANEHFGSRVPGWETDFGRIYITFGPPDEIDSHPTGGTYERPAAEGGGVSTTVPFEDWRYRFIEGIGKNVLIEFVDTAGTGEYHMTVDPVEKDTVAGTTPAVSDQFERLRLFARLQTAPQLKLRELEVLDAAGALKTYTTLPMLVRVDYLRAAGNSAIANITIQFENKDLQFQLEGGVEKAHVNLLGQISTVDRRPVSTFEKPLEIDTPAGTEQNFASQRSLYQQSVPFSPGRYRLNILAQDTVSGNLNKYEVALNVRAFDENTLASSSLILADIIEAAPSRAIRMPAFLIGGTRVRPRLGNKFSRDEKVGIYLQLYNFGPDPATNKPSGSIEYEIDKAGSNEKIMDFSEEAGSLANASASQVTVEKMLPLRTFEPGTYTLKITANDRNRNQTLRQQANFTVSAE